MRLDFAHQLKYQQIKTANNFNNQVECRFQITKNLQYLERNKTQIKFYQKQNYNKRLVYLEVEEIEACEWINAIAELIDNRRIVIYSKLGINAQPLNANY